MSVANYAEVWTAPHWTFRCKPEPISEERYWELLECLPPAWQGHNRFAVGEPSYDAGDELVTCFPCCWKRGDQAYRNAMPIKAIQSLSWRELDLLVSGTFVACDGRGHGYCFRDHECIGRFYDGHGLQADEDWFRAGFTMPVSPIVSIM